MRNYLRFTANISNLPGIGHAELTTDLATDMPLFSRVAENLNVSQETMDAALRDVLALGDDYDMDDEVDGDIDMTAVAITTMPRNWFLRLFGLSGDKRTLPVSVELSMISKDE